MCVAPCAALTGPAACWIEGVFTLQFLVVAELLSLYGAESHLDLLLFRLYLHVRIRLFIAFDLFRSNLITCCNLMTLTIYAVPQHES